MTSQEASKEQVRRWITGIWVRGNFELLQELATEDYVYSYPGQEGLRGNSFVDYVRTIRSAIPDLNNTIEEQVADGDTIVTRGTTRGTHQGAFGDIAATGNSIEVPWVMFTKLKNGRIAEEWEIFDTLIFMTQLGAISVPE
jgi:steroid delta-isomerase-like uncharacterized protein